MAGGWRRTPTRAKGEGKQKMPQPPPPHLQERGTSPQPGSSASLLRSPTTRGTEGAGARRDDSPEEKEAAAASAALRRHSVAQAATGSPMAPPPEAAEGGKKERRRVGGRTKGEGGEPGGTVPLGRCWGQRLSPLRPAAKLSPQTKRQRPRKKCAVTRPPSAPPRAALSSSSPPAPFHGRGGGGRSRTAGPAATAVPLGWGRGEPSFSLPLLRPPPACYLVK